jgi:predicted ester cyclase
MGKEMSVMGSIEIVKAAMAAADAGDWDKASGYFSDDMVFAGPVPEPMGKAGFVGMQTAMRAGIPDWKFNASDFKEDGDKVTARMQITGTQTRELKLPMPGLAPIPATNKKISLPNEPATFTVKDGKITRLETAATPGGGVMGLLGQLGVQMPH